MSERIRWVNHQGSKILVFDFSCLIGSSIVEQADLCRDYIINYNKNNILLLVDVTRTADIPEAQMRFAEIAKEIKPLTKKTAVLGLSSVKILVTNIINKISNINAKGFISEEKARRWLCDN